MATTHPVLVEARLREAAEPLQIEYPAGYAGMKSSPDAAAIFIGTTPAYYYEAELDIVAAAVASIDAYAQGVVRTGAVKTEDDPLMALTDSDHDLLDGLEIGNNLPLTRSLADGTDRAIRDRVALIREHGYRGGMPEVIMPEPAPVPIALPEPIVNDKKPANGKKTEAAGA